MLGHAYQSYELSRLTLESEALTSQVETLISQVDELELRNYKLVQKNAQLSGSSRIEHDAYMLANQTLIKLQQKLLEQKEELVFYRGIVSPKDAALGINLQTFEVKRKSKDGIFSYKMVLTKRGESTKKITGTTKVLIRGKGKEGKQEFLLSKIDFDKSEKSAKFSFRYFQIFEGAFSLTDDFTPYEIELSIVSTTKKVKSFTEKFSWVRVLSEDS